MTYNEKSAWVMTLALLVGAAVYFNTVASLSTAGQGVASPSLPTLVVCTVVIVVVAVAGHIVAAVLAPDDAQPSADERDRRIFDRAGHLAGYVLGAGTLGGLGGYLFTHDGHLLFYTVFASLIASQVAEYALQIYYYRRGIQ